MTLEIRPGIHRPDWSTVTRPAALVDISVPLLGTGFVETPRISGGRSIVHFIFFLVCLYFGFVRKPRANTPRFMSVGDR